MANTLDPNADPQDIIGELDSMLPEDVARWLEANAYNMSPATAAQVLTYFESKDRQDSGTNYLNPNPDSKTRQRLGILGDGAAQAVVNAALNDESTSMDLNNDGTVDEDEERQVQAAVDEAAKAYAGQTGVPISQAKQVIESKVAGMSGGVTGGGKLPDALSSALGGRIPTPEEIDRLITTWNYLNPNEKILDGDITDLYSKLSVPTPDVQNVLEATFYGIDPVKEYSVMLADGRKVIVDADEFGAFQSLYGLQSHEMSTLIRAAGRLGIVNHAGDVAFQMLAPLAVAERSRGGYNPFPNLADVDDSVTVSRMTTRGQMQDADAVADRAQQARTVSLTQRLNNLGLKFKEGQYIYAGNDLLAYMHALDPSLAAKLSGNPKSLAPQDMYKAQQLIIDGKFNQEQLAKMGYYSTALAEWYDEKGYSDRGGGGGGPTRMIADQDALRQAAIEMYRAMFAQDPTDQDVKKLMDAANGAVASAAPNQSIDVQAKIKAQLQKDSKYKELYGNRPGGMTEEEYQGQFRGGAASLLGEEAADPSAIQSGMRTGDYQTTIGRVASSEKAWGNSRFLGRLAEAAALVSENT